MQQVTRFGGSDAGSVLYLVFTDDDCALKDIDIGSPLGRSDQASITACFDTKLQERKHKKKIYMYEKANYEAMKKYLCINWKDYLGV